MSLATEHVSLQHIIPPAYADNERREGLRLLLDLRRLDQGVGKRPDARGCNQASEVERMDGGARVSQVWASGHALAGLRADELAL